MFLCAPPPTNIGQEAMALNHQIAFIPFGLGVSFPTWMSGSCLGSQETSDDPGPRWRQHLFSSARYFSFQSLHGHR